MQTIEEAVQEAISLCRDSPEEQGGIIVHHESANDYRFIKLRNSLEGNPEAHALYLADRNEYGSRIIPLFREGWKLWGSFHTHPKFMAFPSQLDITKLFTGFPNNFIYSCSQDVVAKYIWQNGQVVPDNFQLLQTA